MKYSNDGDSYDRSKSPSPVKPNMDFMKDLIHSTKVVTPHDVYQPAQQELLSEASDGQILLDHITESQVVKEPPIEPTLIEEEFAFERGPGLRVQRQYKYTERLSFVLQNDRKYDATPPELDEKTLEQIRLLRQRKPATPQSKRLEERIDDHLQFKHLISRALSTKD